MATFGRIMRRGSAGCPRSFHRYSTFRKSLTGSVCASAGINKIDLKTRYFSFVKKSFGHNLIETLLAGRYSRRTQTVENSDGENIGLATWVGDFSPQKAWPDHERSFVFGGVRKARQRRIILSMAPAFRRTTPANIAACHSRQKLPPILSADLNRLSIQPSKGIYDVPKYIAGLRWVT